MITGSGRCIWKERGGIKIQNPKSKFQDPNKFQNANSKTQKPNLKSQSQSLKAVAANVKRIANLSLRHILQSSYMTPDMGK
jgi:hypothetical protein